MLIKIFTGPKVISSDTSIPKKRSISKTEKIIAAKEEEAEKAAAKAERAAKMAERAKKKEESLKATGNHARPRPRPTGRRKT